MLKKIKNNIWQFYFRSFGSCVYFVKLSRQSIIIDTGSLLNRNELIEDLNELKIKCSEIDILLLTHNHPDHTGNINIFKNAKFYGDKKDFPSEEVIDINKLDMPDIQTIKTPGHTRGSISFYMPKEKILFSGDTLFHHGGIGRMDLPGGSESEMKKSLEKLEKIDYEILCPGHL